MKLEGLRTFLAHLESEFASEDVQITIYYYFEERWHDLTTLAPSSESDSLCLENARADEVAHHGTSSWAAWFYLPNGDCAVQLRFPQSPRLAKRKRYRATLLKLQEGASNAYKVEHNPLTQLLARDAFRNRVGEAIRELQEQKVIASEAQEGDTPRALAVLALDLDHFKQINDTWGHLYGDQVLKTLGRRLEHCASTIVAKGPGTPSLHIGHPSGEEFLVSIAASATREQLLEWANEFRKAIGDEILPSEAEWKWLLSTDSLAGLSPPPIHERTTTISGGLALYIEPATLDSSTEPVSSLLDRADTALYRAKAAGRNQVISYDEVLSSCGRIIEHDKATGVVAIDIGSNVGVAIGQEFRVFSPTYSGRTKFLVSDGRTERTLGIYPKVESARIVTFDAQPELAFAYVASPTPLQTLLEKGSHLEAIPAGSIGHLLPSSLKYRSSLESNLGRDASSEIHEYIAAAAAEDHGPFAVVVRFSSENEHLKKYGSVALNAALANLYQEAHLKFAKAKFIEVIDRAAICVIGHEGLYSEELVVDFVESMANDQPELGIVAGIFCESDRAQSISDQQLPLDSTSALEFARFAAADAGRSPETRVRHFNYMTAIAALQALRAARSFEVAYADFEQLRRLGLESAMLLNLGGLIADRLQRFQQAREHYAAAMSKDPGGIVYKSNFATAAYRTGDIDAGLRILNALPKESVEWVRKHHQFGFFTYARLLAAAGLGNVSSFDLERFKEVAEPALSLPEYADSPGSDIIRQAIRALI